MAENKSASSPSFITPTRVVATLLVIGLVYLGRLIFFDGGAEVKPGGNIALPASPAATAPPSSASAGSPPAAPPDFVIPTLDGKTIKLSDYRGKVLVVDFWATWCPPCRQETPQLVKIANENKGRGVEVIGLHIDDQGRSTPEAIRSFVSQFSVPYTVGLATNDMFFAYLGHDDDSIPQTLVFGRDGKLIKHLIGYDASHSGALDDAVSRALAGS